MITPRCLTCKFFLQQLQDKNTGQGVCRRYPPTLLIIPSPKGPQPASIFLAVKISEWCGEHRVKIIEASSTPSEHPQ